ncbi:hypothetical protein [Polyangium sp. 6x1]|uniref:hypothetical protein n=1 Tax=Polyangium sp. 6x1 TaxID=3042689 RepID=UPI0024827E0C|nr:hypothetical protein [Polyangium sp. 6x1]MDI1451115.1 hypothetical protein [Polyangium sp. 6x1]
MRLSLSAVLASVALGCASSAATGPTVVSIPEAPAQADAAPAPDPAPPAKVSARHPRSAVIERVDAKLRASSRERRSIQIDAKGRIVVRDAAERYEEELFLDDVERVEYELEAQRPEPHFVKLWIKSSGASRTRYRMGDADWMLSTSNYVVLSFSDEASARDAAAALRSITAP